jgi:endonuclease I
MLKLSLVRLAPRNNSFVKPVLAFAIGLLLVQAVRAAYEAPNSAYNAPTHYYDTASGTGTTLKTSLHNIISTGFTGRTYGDFRFASAILDQDPNNPNNILLVYNRASVSNIWDSGVTWSREHTIPVSWLGTGDPGNNDSPSIETDEFELRPVNPGLNSSRSNNFYGLPTTTGGQGRPPSNTQAYYPGDADAGELARGYFYLATRYFTGSPTLSLNNIQLVNTSSIPATGSFKAGDLASLLKWNYEFGVDNFERRRNQMIYGSAGDNTDHALNPTYYQGNRNPYIDHPEYVWSVFGTHTDGSGNIINNSQISVASPDGGGASSTTVNLGSVITGANFGTSNVTVNKTGADPTTFNVTASGAASTVAAAGFISAGVGQAMDYNIQTRTIKAALDATGGAGLKTGAITLHNTDLTTAGAGQGSADGDDAVNVTGTVLDHANGSFAGGSDTNSLQLNFGTLAAGTGVAHLQFQLFNLMATQNFTSSLDLIGITSSGDTSKLTTDLSLLDNLAAGGNQSFTANLDTSQIGTFSATYFLNSSDDTSLTGATAGQQLVLTLTGSVAAVPEPASIALLVTGVLIFRFRRRA